MLLLGRVRFRHTFLALGSVQLDTCCVRCLICGAKPHTHDVRLRSLSVNPACIPWHSHSLGGSGSLSMLYTWCCFPTPRLPLRPILVVELNCSDCIRRSKPSTYNVFRFFCQAHGQNIRALKMQPWPCLAEVSATWLRQLSETELQTVSQGLADLKRHPHLV